MGLARQGVDIYGVLIRTDAGIHVHDTNVLQKAYIKGDERFTEIALASILAKETRDAYMHNLHTNNPEYGWNTNAGYGTEKHRTALQVHGTTKYHRHSFLQSFKQLQNKEEK
jgi:ribonuclease HII